MKLFWFLGLAILVQELSDGNAFSSPSAFLHIPSIGGASNATSSVMAAPMGGDVAEIATDVIPGYPNLNAFDVWLAFALPVLLSATFFWKNEGFNMDLEAMKKKRSPLDTTLDIMSEQHTHGLSTFQKTRIIVGVIGHIGWAVSAFLGGFTSTLNSVPPLKQFARHMFPLAFTLVDAHIGTATARFQGKRMWKFYPYVFPHCFVVTLAFIPFLGRWMYLVQQSGLPNTLPIWLCSMPLMIGTLVLHNVYRLYVMVKNGFDMEKCDWEYIVHKCPFSG